MKRLRLMPAVCLLALGLLVILSAGCAQCPMGPENHGLRLGLTIHTAPAATSATDAYAVRLDLLNSGKQPVVMVANWPYEELTGDYAEFLKSAVEFLTFPEVQPPTAQTSGATRQSPQPEFALKPGEHLVIQWKALGALKPAEVFDSANTAPAFPSPGLYGVRARVLLLTDGGERILLTSNEQPVAVGGSIGMPKYATAQIVSAYPDKKTATINLGSDQGIAVGDKFLIKWGLQASWRLTITNVGQQFSDGAVETIHSEGSGTPAFPPERWTATLEEMPRL